MQHGGVPGQIPDRRAPVIGTGFTPPLVGAARGTDGRLGDVV